MSNSTPTDKKEPQTEDNNLFWLSYNGLVSIFLSQQLAEQNNENIVFSPYSLLSLFSILSHSVAGKTKEEIERKLHAGLFAPMLKEIGCKLTENGTFYNANAVCVNHTLQDKIRDSYIEVLHDIFRGKVFSSSDFVKDVNRWVKRNTHGMIQEILDDSQSDILACLMNAVAFEGKWRDPYENDDVYDEEFHNADKTTSLVPMLHSTEDEYIEEPDFTGCVKPYAGCGFDFMALLPRKHGSDEILRQAKSIDYSLYYRLRQPEEVIVTMPEFKYSFSTDLKKYCENLGIRMVFSNQADFSPMTDEWLKVDKIVHKAFIAVDRHGTKAAAITFANMMVGSICVFEKKRIILDRPFFYAIMHRESGLPVFAGCVNTLRK